ncbi:MAG: hypothetical protein WBG43_12580 [Marinifilaceae bacterium]
MSEKLNFREKRVIRNYMRPGLLIGLIIMLLFALATFIISGRNAYIFELVNRIMMTGVLLTIVVIWFIIKRYIKDLSIGRKTVEYGIISSKCKVGETLLFVVDGRDYKVNFDIWDSAMEGDRVELYFSFVSKAILGISLKDKGIINYY